MKAVLQIPEGTDGQIGSSFVLSGDMSLDDTGPRSDPFIIRVDHLFQIVICENALGCIFSQGCYGGSFYRHFLPNFSCGLI